MLITMECGKVLLESLGEVAPLMLYDAETGLMEMVEFLLLETVISRFIRELRSQKINCCESGVRVSESAFSENVASINLGRNPPVFPW